MACFVAPHGVRGLLRLQVFSRQPALFTAAPKWWCRPPDGGDWRELQVTQCVPHGNFYLATLPAIATREDAAEWSNGIAALPYDALPKLEDDTHYWCDLIGMMVQNTAGETLGEVAEIMDIGVHDVLCVDGKDNPDGKDTRRRLIPFVSKHILEVDTAARIIHADWESEW